MIDLKYVTYCGLYCRLCGNMARTPQQAATLKRTLEKDGWPIWGASAIEGFGMFWTVLEKFTKIGESCPGCRGGCGNPECSIRQCAQEKAIEVCSSCDEYPCEKIHGLAKRYPMLISDGMRQRQVGLERWIEEQEARCQTGACYADFRHPS